MNVRNDYFVMVDQEKALQDKITALRALENTQKTTSFAVEVDYDPATFWKKIGASKIPELPKSLKEDVEILFKLFLMKHSHNMTHHAATKVASYLLNPDTKLSSLIRQN